MGRLRRVILYYTQGHAASALSLAGAMESISQHVDHLNVRTSEPIESFMKMEDECPGQQQAAETTGTPITDYKAWATLATSSTSKESIMTCPEWYNPSNCIVIVANAV